MKKIFSIILVLALSITVLAACGKKEPEADPVTNDASIVGTWSEEFFDSGFIFNADATGTDTFWDLTFTYSAVDGKLVLIYDDDMWGTNNYDYVVSGDTLKLTWLDEGAETPTTYEYKKAASATAPTQAAGDGAQGADQAETQGPDGETPAETESAEN